MPSELIAVLGTLFGALVGGLINYFATRSHKGYEWRLALAREQSANRQKLYSELLVEAQRLVVQSREDKITSLSDLDVLNGKFAEVSLVAPEAVIEAAKTLADYALTSHSAQPAHEVANFFAAKQAFITAARKDIDSLLSEA